MSYYKMLLISQLWKCAFGNPLITTVNRQAHRIPFLDFYERVTGKCIDDTKLKQIQKKNPKLKELTAENLSKVQQVLEAYGIEKTEACAYPDLLTIHPLTLENRICVLRECGFVAIRPRSIVRYHTLVRSHNIKQLKDNGFIRSDINMEEQILRCFDTWPPSHCIKQRLPEATTSILEVRLLILSKFLNWKLGLSEKEFENYCRNYLVLKHRPMTSVLEAIDRAQNEINFSIDKIKRNGFIVGADPTNTKQILDNVPQLAGVDIKQVIRLVPAIIKNNYASIVRIRDILEEYRISDNTQRRGFSVYCMSPDTVQERLAQLATMKEFQVLSSNPRALQLVVYHKKMLGRLSRLRAANKSCYSLQNLLSSSSKFEEYINNFGNRTCSRDLAIIICSSLRIDMDKYIDPHYSFKRKTVRYNSSSGESVVDIAKSMCSPPVNFTMGQLRRHTYWRNIPHDIVHANIAMLKEHFDDDVIYKHCQLLLYPKSEIEMYLNSLKRVRAGEEGREALPDGGAPHLDYTRLSDEQLLSLVLYSIEKRYHFTGDGIWSTGGVSATPQYKQQATG